MEEKVEKKVILQPGNPSKPSPALEKPLVKLPTTRQASLKSKDQTALEICLQKMGELVKKEPVTPSPDTTSSSRLVTLEASKVPRNPVKKKSAISSLIPKNLIVLDVHTAFSNFDQTSSDSDKEIEKLGSQATPPKKIWISKFRGKESSETFHRKRIAAKYYRKQKFKMLIVPVEKNNHPYQKHQENALNVGKETTFVPNVEKRMEPLSTLVRN